jgi:anaerobic magnesium-protoporphyrin IX monomethyl ester cyclase
MHQPDSGSGRFSGGTEMARKPSILFIAITPPEYAPSKVRQYGIGRTFELIPHKHSVLALVAWLRENGCDGYYEWINPGDENGRAWLLQSIRTLRPDAFGFSLVTEELLAHYELIEHLKAQFPDIPVIVGGPHVSAEPVHTLQTFPAIDYVSIGEGENTLTEWLRLVARKKSSEHMRDVKGLAFRDSSYGILITTPREKISDINTLPDPAFDLIVNGKSKSYKSAAFPIVCSYGCRYYCTFCAADHGNYRYMPPHRIVNQIQNAQELYGVEYFAFRDSFWPPSGDWLDEFCDLVERRGLKFSFHFETRAGTLNLEQLQRLKRIGVQAIAVGVESGDPAMLKSIKKAITPDLARQTFRNLHLAAIPSIAFFMFGNQGETHETAEKSIEFMYELNPTLVSISTFRPLPGTEAFRYVSYEDRNWWMYGEYPSICDLPTAELHKIRQEADITYPLRLAYPTQHVYNARLPVEVRELTWNYFKIHLRKYLLGISEQYPLLRGLIHRLKKTLKPVAQDCSASNVTSDQ